ncbi:TPM domain-containing protein [Sphingomonas sp. LB-2]|uniref:TPM domain-containing protein n=1 Tax=Sphingomonas caeni TaxID=2984949 RepID=UPI002231B0C3|nr:TPM domain-containing protein [Sphingomonas caeni]MCW3847031.1 TPM domain-containing protein [Sphingomonas caeni]
MTSLAPSPAPSPAVTPAGRIADMAGLLSDAQKAELSAKLGALERRTGQQVVIATTPTLNGRDLDDAAEELGNRLGVHDGVLLLVAVKERELRLMVGRGSLKLLTKSEADAIIHKTMYPDLHANHFAAGILKGADRIIAELSETRA